MQVASAKASKMANKGIGQSWKIAVTCRNNKKGNIIIQPRISISFYLHPFTIRNTKEIHDGFGAVVFGFSI